MNDSLLIMSSKKSSSSSSKELRIQTEPTATMLTMDQQGVDDMILMKQGSPMEQHSRNDSSCLPSDTNTDKEGKPSWWKRGLDTLRKVASNDDDDEQDHAPGTTQETAHYKPLQDHSSSKAASNHPRFAQSDGNERLKRSLGGSPRVLSESLLRGGGRRRDETTTRSVIDVLATRGERGSTTQEDALQEDCSFFYKAHEEGDVENSNTSNLPPRGRFRALRFEEHQHAFSYQDAVDVLTPSLLQAYRSRYEQLNQADPLYADNNNAHELILSESQDNLVEIQRIVKSETTVNSSIFYEHDGRVLMRLPIDAVRLVMDPDLEAGVLSVEQWRHDETDQDAPPGGLGLVAAQQDSQPLQERPPLRYVLTVSPDLYRKIVSEMSDGLTNPYCGFSKCCSDSGKADIRIAIFILLFVFFVLFISTEVLGPHS